jgi:DNA-binding response OmpR family regulator
LAFIINTAINRGVNDIKKLILKGKLILTHTLNAGAILNIICETLLNYWKIYMEKILIIEDEKDLVTGLKFNLEARSFTVVESYDGEDGFIKAINEKPDLILLDIMLPKKNGYQVCRELKEKMPDVPVIMLTAKSQEEDIVAGLELGADDYITKPFSILELIARIKTALRRVKQNNILPDIVNIGNLEINFKKYIAKKRSKLIELSSREFEILKYFIEKKDEIVTREELLNQVWGYESFPNTRTVDTHIANLRQKIEDSPDNPKIIITMYGMGYKLLG